MGEVRLGYMIRKPANRHAPTCGGPNLSELAKNRTDGAQRESFARAWRGVGPAKEMAALAPAPSLPAADISSEAHAPKTTPFGEPFQPVETVERTLQAAVANGAAAVGSTRTRLLAMGLPTKLMGALRDLFAGLSSTLERQATDFSAAMTADANTQLQSNLAAQAERWQERLADQDGRYQALQAEKAAADARWSAEFAEQAHSFAQERDALVEALQKAEGESHKLSGKAAKASRMLEDGRASRGASMEEDEDETAKRLKLQAQVVALKEQVTTPGEAHTAPARTAPCPWPMPWAPLPLRLPTQKGPLMT